MSKYYEEICKYLFLSFEEYQNCELFSDKSSMLCFAMGSSRIPEEVKEQLYRKISSALAGHGSVRNWLVARGFVPLVEDSFEEEAGFWYEQVQQYRKRWLKHLLSELGYE